MEKPAMSGAWIIGVFVAVVALAGLFLASSAHGNQTFYTMGLGFFALGCVFIFILIKQAFDRRS
jgi:hypothetical protein